MIDRLDLSKYEGDKSATFNAYYYRFDATGVEPIDTVLKVVACAGKAYHHTEGWSDTDVYNPSVADEIQVASNDAANAIGALLAEDKALRAEVDQLRRELAVAKRALEIMADQTPDECPLDYAPNRYKDKIVEAIGCCDADCTVRPQSCWMTAAIISAAAELEAADGEA
jgi:hypothetical protein